MGNSHDPHHKPNDQGASHGGGAHHHHHIMPDKVAIAVGSTLLLLTLVTVWVAGIDLGKLNFLVAMLVAITKASLVCLFFMNLKYDRRENGVIFATSFLFLAIFIVLTSTDLFFRGDVYVDKRALAAAAASRGGVSKLVKPWISTPELVARGKELFEQQCISCHGPHGEGNGPAAAALNPPPRNFTKNENWKNGRKAVLAFKTLTEGLGGMPTFGSLPGDDRWALAQYVMSLGPDKPADPTSADFAKANVDPNAVGGGAAKEKPSIPVEFAIDRLAVPEAKANGQ